VSKERNAAIFWKVNQSIIKPHIPENLNPQQRGCEIVTVQVLFWYQEVYGYLAR
jgi:hypothetical protein